jgi:hypothetical protein
MYIRNVYSCQIAGLLILFYKQISPILRLRLTFRNVLIFQCEELLDLVQTPFCKTTPCRLFSALC